VSSRDTQDDTSSGLPGVSRPEPSGESEIIPEGAEPPAERAPRPGSFLKDLRAASHAALLSWPALALDRNLDSKLEKAVAAYFGGDWAKTRKLVEKIAKGAGSFLDARTWIELEEKRPVLFPRRKDAAGKRFASKIGKLVRNADDTQLTRLIRGMLAELERL